VWLRFYDGEGNLVPLPEEAAEAKGLKQGVLRQLMRLLVLRFGEVPQSLETRLEGLTVERLETLVEVVLKVNSLDQFIGDGLE